MLGESRSLHGDDGVLDRRHQRLSLLEIEAQLLDRDRRGKVSQLENRTLAPFALADGSAENLGVKRSSGHREGDEVTVYDRGAHL